MSPIQGGGSFQAAAGEGGEDPAEAQDSEDGKGHLQTVEEGGRVLLNTQFRIASGGTILIGGPHFGPGVLIVALSAAAR